jgi:outer membrane protein TolC
MGKTALSFILHIALCIYCIPLNAQGDTTSLDYHSFIELVRKSHPLAKSAFLLDDEARAILLRAKGAFDPELKYNHNQKEYDNKRYYRHTGGKLDIPTRSPVKIQAGYLDAEGVFLNPENNLPDQGQAIAGLEMPLIRGLLTDTRRTQLREAEIIQSMNAEQRRLLLNDLLFTAGMSYYSWAEAQMTLEIRINALQLAKLRFEAVRESYLVGDLPAVDTLESFLQVQSRENDLQKAQRTLINAQYDLNSFMWDLDGRPLDLTGQAEVPNLDSLPEAHFELEKQYLLIDPPINHPQLEIGRRSIDQFEVIGRLKKEYLKPKLDAQFHLLGQGTDFVPNTGSEVTFNEVFSDNYKLGLNFSMPLFLRESRGDLKLNEVKIARKQQELQDKTWSLANKFRAQQKTYAILSQQDEILRQMTRNYERLLNAERQKFDIGESSLFLINSREVKLIESQIKLIQNQIKIKQTGIKLLWTGGLLAE